VVQILLPLDVIATAVIPVLDIVAEIQNVNAEEIVGAVDNQVVP